MNSSAYSQSRVDYFSIDAYELVIWVSIECQPSIDQDVDQV